MTTKNNDIESSEKAVLRDDLFGWVLVADREPTAENCDAAGYVWMWMPAYEQCGAQYAKIDAIHKATHWQPINLKCHLRPPSPPNAKVEARPQ